MKAWKKNLVAAAVLVTVCAGIYVNWLYTEENVAADLTDTLDVEKVMSDEALVLSEDMAAIASGEDVQTTLRGRHRDRDALRAHIGNAVRIALGDDQALDLGLAEGCLYDLLQLHGRFCFLAAFSRIGHSLLEQVYRIIPCLLTGKTDSGEIIGGGSLHILS